MISENPIATFQAVRDRMDMYHEILGLTIPQMLEDAMFSPEELEKLSRGVGDIGMAGRILMILRQKYGVNLHRLMYGTGPLFSFKGPGISEEFYRENRLLFERRDRPEEPARPLYEQARKNQAKRRKI